MDAVVDDALDAHRTEPRADVAGVRRGLHAPADRVANTEGALTGPRRPTNGSPPPAPQTPRARRRPTTRMPGKVDLTSTTPGEPALGTLVTKCRWGSPALPIHWRVDRNADPSALNSPACTS